MAMVIDRKAVRNGVKRGFGFTDFEQKYGLNQENLEEAMYILYKKNINDAKKILQDIASNEKRQAKNSDSKKVVKEQEIKVEEQPADASDVNKVDALEKEIQELEEEIASFSEMLAETEAEHVSWISKHHEYMKKLNTLDDGLGELEEKLMRLKSKYNSVVEADAEVVSKANTVLLERRKIEAALEEKRKRLQDLKEIVICACADGTVTLMDDSISVTLDDSGYDELYIQLVNADECQDLRAREIRAIAKILKITENSSRAFEVICDNAEMEEAYGRLIANMSDNPDAAEAK